MRRAAIVLLASAVSGCPAPRAVEFKPTFASIQREIFNVSCSTRSCHGAPAFKAELNLEEGAAFASLVNIRASNDAARARGMKRVEPGAPDRSFLMIKLTNPGSGEGDTMPSRNARLPAEAIEAVREWIETGATP